MVENGTSRPQFSQRGRGRILEYARSSERGGSRTFEDVEHAQDVKNAKDVKDVKTSALEVGGGAALSAVVFLKDGEDDARPEDGDEPDELGLPDFLLALVDAATENASGEPGLERDEGEDRGSDEEIEGVHVRPDEGSHSGSVRKQKSV
jgi:hypothetical protein